MPYRIIRHFIIILGLFFWSRDTFAQSTDQNFPVTAQAFIVPQANQKLANYFSSSQALTVNLLLKDLTKSSIQVYLKWSMDGPGVRVSSMDGYVPPSFITLQRGMIERLSGLSLQNDYFRNGLIEEQGLGGNPLRTNLPEGFYTFRVQALEAGTGREVSNIGETYFSITTPLPPVINIPFNGAELTVSEPQRVNIQWMPRHYKQAGNITTYDLKVCKVPDGYEPTEALDACVNPVIDDKANPGTFYPGNTGIGNSIIGAFERGARYAARVTIHEFDTDGNEVAFANEGRSEVNWFRYGTPCVSPETFVIKEAGPGRVQLSWETQTDNKSYKILYRKTGESNWTTQTASGTTITIPNLSQGKYEFAVQALCTDVMPVNLQAFELDEEDNEQLPPILQNPLLTQVSVNGKGEPVTVDSLGKILDKIKIPCASQISTYESCEADLPVVSPTGTKPLTTLSPGDVLSIYDMTVIVTSVDGGSAFSGKGLARLPFAENTTVSVEFSGVKAWKGQEGTQGGCVYQIDGYFRTSKLTDQQLASEQSQLIAALNIKTDSTGFNGTLSDALNAYDASTNASSISKYTAAILQGSGAISATLDELVDEDSDPRLIAIKTQLDSLVKVLTVNDSLIRAGGKVTKIDSLGKTYEDLFKKLEELKNESQPDPNNPLYALSNVQVSNVDDQSARISWVPSGNITKYVIEYQDPNGGVLQETVTGTQVNLQRLQPGLQYKYRILAYNGDQVVASYGQDVFSTIRKTVPVPENLAFARIDDNSVTVTWDKNPEHKTYKLVYTDERGEVHYLYPTTNSATLTGLDPGKFYDYEIVAYNQQSLVSDPANARVTSEEQCKLGVSVSNAQNSATITGNKQSLLVTGCLPKTFVPNAEYPKVSWSNGTPGTINANGVIVFRDGETGEVSTKNSPFIGENRALYVDPTKDKSYTAICKMSASAEPCTYTVEVKVSSASCKDDFKITASTEIFNRGESVSIKAENCAGTVLWSNGYGSDKEILLFPSGDVIVSATCVNGDQTCYSNNVSLIEQECVKEIFVFRTRDRDGNKKTGRSVDLIATGCIKGIVWSKEGSADIGSSGSTTTSGQWFSLNNMKGEVKVFAQCQGVADCPPAEFLVPNISSDCAWKSLNYDNVELENALKQGINTITLRASGLMKDLKDSYGKSYITQPVMEVKVPVLSQTTIYHGVLADGCPVAAQIPAANQFRIDWSVTENGKEKELTKDEYDFSTDNGQYLSLSFVSAAFPKSICQGEVIWSNNVDPYFHAKGVTILLQNPPVGTSTYYAECHQVNKDNTISVFPAVNSKVIVVNSESCLTISSSLSPPFYKFSLGDKVTFNVKGCADQVTWSLGGTVIGTGNPFTHVPTSASSTSITYTATCNLPSCSKDIKINVSPCQFKVNSPKTFVKIAEPVTLTTSGCAGGEVTWSTGDAGESVIVKPLHNTKYHAWCTVNGVVTCEDEIGLEVDNFAPDKIECPPFELSYKPALKCSPVTITPKGCPPSGTILWENATTTSGAGEYSFNLVTTHKVRATCTTSYGQTVTSEITVNPTEPEITVSPLEAYAGYPAIFRASGCLNDKCEEGRYSWKNLSTGNIMGGSYIKETLTGQTDFEVSCNGGPAKKVTVKMLEPCDGGYKSPSLIRGKSTLKVNDSCKPEYTITWYEDVYKDGVGLTKSNIIVQNVRQVTVNAVNCVDGFGASYYRAICVDDAQVPCVTSFTVGCNNGGPGGFSSSESPTQPDVCNDFAFVEKQSGTKSTPWYLYSDWCPGSKVEWYRDNAGTDNVTTLVPPAKFSLGKLAATTSFYFKCFIDKEVPCEGSIVCDIKNLRVAAEEDALVNSVVIEKSCPDNIALSTAMEVYYQTLLCQTSNLYTGDRAVAEALLKDIIASLKEKSPGAGIKYPSNLMPVIDAMVAGDCNKAAQLMATANGSAVITNDKFNQNVITPYDNVMNDVVPKEGAQCNAAPAPVVAADVKETINGRVAAYDFTGLFIAPDGRAVKLPAGAKPRIFAFNKNFVAPPAGTLQGFELSNGYLYFAEMSFGHFLGYRLVKKGDCEYLNNIYVAPGTSAYYLDKFSENGQCGYRLIEGQYNFTPTGDASMINISVPVSGETIVTWNYDICTETSDWVTGADGIKRKTITHADSKFYLEDKNGNITVKGEWKTFSKCPTCKDVAEKALQNALNKARAKNSGKLTEKTTVVGATEKKYGPAGSVFYTEMKLGDIIKNLAETYNSFLENVKVPAAAWQPGGKFYVRDETAVISGAIDQGLEELRDIPDMVGLGLTLASDPDGAYDQLKTFAQQMDWEKAKSIGIEIGRGAVFADEFEKGGKYALHATGRAGVVVAKTVVAGAALLVVVKDAPNELKKATDILKDWIVDLTKIKKINGRFPINSQMYSGKKFSFDVNQNLPLQAKNAGEVPNAVKTRMDALHAKYPNGVDFDEFGFARFEPYIVKINGKEAKVIVQTSGNRSADFSVADTKMGIDFRYRDENKLTWHHVEDTNTMILVPFDLHNEVKHTGGIAVFKNDITVEE